MIRWKYTKANKKQESWWVLKENGKLVYFKLIKTNKDWDIIIRENLDIVESLKGTWRNDRKFRLHKLEKEI